MNLILVKSVLLVLFALCNGKTQAVSTIAPESEDERLQVTLPNGKIQGVELQTSTGLHYFAFRGIPYAAAPIGDLRFKAPEPAPNWDGVLNATEDTPSCVQIFRSKAMGSEDCLVVNVYTQDVRPKILRSVMVWIYGGAFINGFSTSKVYGPDYLLEKDVILVTFNYRVGVFGFLSTEDLHSPGNYGLKDQVAALRWVQKNIERFGGNPSDVTIFGESAGAASVSYLLLAPQANGLFQRAISESGSALCPWALQRNPRKIAFDIGTGLGIFTTSTEQLVDKLRKAKAETLLAASTNAAIFNSILPLNGLAYSPTIEPEHEDACLTKGSHELFATGQFNRVPYIIGWNSEESAVLREMVNYLRIYLVTFDAIPTTLVPADMNMVKLSLSYLDAGYRIKRFYFGLLSTIAKNKDILQFISDSQFVKPIRETVRQMSKHTSVYLYEFAYEGALGIQGNARNNEENPERTLEGVGHSEELWYLFKRFDLSMVDERDIKHSDVFRTLWANFAKFGNPTPFAEQNLKNITWPLSTEENEFTYLDIDNELFLYHRPHSSAMKFWDDLYEKYGKPPYNTY